MALDKDQLIKVYVLRLVSSLVPQEFGQEYIQSLAADLHSYLLTGMNQDSKNTDVNQLVDHFKKQFLSRGLMQEWILFQQILDQLIQHRSIDSIVNYLILLYHLQSGSNSNSQVNQGNYIQSSPFNDQITSNHNTPILGHSNLNRPTSENSNNSNGDPKATFINSASNSIPLQDLIHPYYESLSDNEILAYLSYTLCGLDSKLLPISKINGQDGLQIQIPETLNHSYTCLLTSIIEAGILYDWLKSSVDMKKGKLPSPIKTAYLRVLELELSNYLNHITSLFNDSSKIQSLLQVYNQIQGQILKLRLFYMITKENIMTDKNGYEFLLQMWKFSKFGDSNISITSKQIFEQISVPYYEIIEHWIIKGELVDNNDEFFISYNIEENHINDIIQFNSKKIPDFFTLVNKEIGYKIFQIGKNLIFLNKYCKELNWINNYNVKYTQFIFNVHQGLKSMNMNLINNLIRIQFDETLNYLTLIIFQKNLMFDHLINFKKFYLMNSNDFIESIIENGSSLFSKTSDSLTSNQLSNVLIESINSSTIKNYPLEFVNRLDARILDLTHGNMGWEVFTLEYKIHDLPIENIIYYDHGLLEYLKMFNFFWKLRHLQYLLNEGYIEYNDIWKNDLSFILKNSIKLKKASNLNIREHQQLWLLKSFKTIGIMRNQMIMFITTMIRFFSIDLVEDCFHKLIIEKLFKSKNPKHASNSNNQKLAIFNKTFAKSIQNKKIIGLEPELVEHNMNEYTIDELISIHQKYIHLITNYKLFSEDQIGKVSGDSYIKNIYALLEIVFMFIKASEEFGMLIRNYIAITNIEKGLQGGSNEEYDDDLEIIDDKLKLMFNQIYNQTYLQDFKSTKELFVKDLKSDLDLKDLSRSL
ncbi:hypothetical protein HYPBUDRAFT_5945 [Hyphopichia burtonii NRRL Y-1933]|uniref:Spindle pole body component n=1 Tax=Hyphopichia burtonii NRRL Y-1933 TaxID=984485 RepID=A0A1E4RLK4_9ASCO|nr:hypothetical protein HYPBUDRAFT_5945 [Hyphopichia burtonii NRRL Y-1933]ODV68142.1 hypothetical protein HYPBUDRAFT_5945 [Hyphopichia burtonii NRRL Y-1933]